MKTVTIENVRGKNTGVTVKEKKHANLIYAQAKLHV